MPPFIAADTAVICCIGVTDTPCPKAVVANSTGPTLSKLNIIPSASPFKSTPVFLPKPNLSMYEKSFSFPKRLPNSTNPGLLYCKRGTTWFKKNRFDIAICHF